GRQVHDEVIELTPLHAAEKLLNDAVEHGAAPDERLVARIQQAHGDHFHAVGFNGDDGALVEGARLLGRSEHNRDIRAVDVGIEKADFRAQSLESNGQVDGDGGLPYPALAAGDGDEILDARKGRSLLKYRSGLHAVPFAGKLLGAIRTLSSK